MTFVIMRGHHFMRQNIIKHHPVVCQHSYISSVCTTSKNDSCKSDVFITMLPKIHVFGDIMPCWLVCSYQCSARTKILQNIGNSWPMNTVQHLRRLVPTSCTAFAIQQITYSIVKVSLCPLILSLLLKWPACRRKVDTISIDNHRYINNIWAGAMAYADGITRLNRWLHHGSPCTSDNENTHTTVHTKQAEKWHIT